MLEEILDYRNVQKALKQVVSNRGAAGTDGMETGELTAWVEANWMIWKTSILEGSYRPQAVRKVEIPKVQGGTRMLGIPSVRDRLLQQAIHQWLSPQYEPEFSSDSYGFREGRNAHQAVLRAQNYLNEGKVWVIEMDLEKFFDRVNHDKLMGLLAKRILDKRTLKLIRSYLNSGIMEGGMVSQRLEGVPQGSPLSPLLSNIVLHELDKEISDRGHRFVRYADDVSIYVRSEKSANRVKESITEYIEKKLKLKVNREKSKVSQPTVSALLGFSFYPRDGKWEIRVSPKALRRVKEKLKSKTKRKDPAPIKEKIKKLEALIEGWVNYFRIAKAKRAMDQMDQMLRTRLRMGIWKQWKTPDARQKQLRKLGASPQKAYKWTRSRWGYYRMATGPALKTTITNNVLLRMGYKGFLRHYTWKTTTQAKLF
jgi:RNA-directed DNA polymerase